MSINKFTIVSKIISCIKVVSNDDSEIEVINNIKNFSRPAIISFVNAHAINLAINCPVFFKNLCDSDFIFRDGVGVKSIMSCLLIDSGKNMNGTDFIPRFFQHFSGSRFAFYGTDEPWLSSSVNIIRKDINVVDFSNGFHDHYFYVQRIKEALPDVVILGMGMPKQESIAILIRESCSHPCVIINGGAVLDFIAGRFPRAPAWMRSFGLEWFFRLVQEPKRMFSRYIVGGFKSAYILLICLIYRKINKDSN